jgi:hemerythrin-like domain-containing protein
MSDAVQMLEEQHAQAIALFMKLERLSDPATLEAIFRTLDGSLRDHTVIEEEIFYPAFRERAARAFKGGVDEALHEHGELKAAIKDAESTAPVDYTFKTKISALKRMVAEHVQEEEHTILPQARRIFSQDELDELGLRMAELVSLHSSVYDMGDTSVKRAARSALYGAGELVTAATG